MRILITGGAGFVGHHVVEHFIKNTDWQIIVLDKLSYATSGWDRLRDVNCYDERRVERYSWDFTNPLSEGIAQELGEINIILHMGAASHVDRSIADPLSFERDNVLGTLNMLEYARTAPGLERFIYFGTDEVYGSAKPFQSFKEGDRFNPGNPYAASKAAAECFCYAYSNTYKVPVQITNTMNVFGERQHPEKFVPLVIGKVLSGEEVTIHADPDLTRSGVRSYLHARNVAAALMFIIQKIDTIDDKTLDNYEADFGKFNIVGEKEMSNLDMAKLIAECLGKQLKYKMVDFHSSRPGHDLRYSLDGSKLATLGWKPPITLEDSIAKTVQWTLKNPRWLE